MGLNLPVRVQGHSADGAAWEEMTTSDDASFGGASVALKHPVEKGQVLHLDLPLPKRFRRYAMTDASYHVYALVRDATASPARVGVMFIGKNPPKGYEQNPSGRYLLPSDPAPARKERRQFQRLEMFVNFTLRRTDPGGEAAQEERTVAENLGKGGARVMTSLPLTKGEIVQVEEMGGAFRTRAEIKNVYIGQDRIPRVNLHFIDSEAPDRLVSMS